MASDVAILREILWRELETINLYEELSAKVTDPKLRSIIDHITDEEREHVAEMYELIMAYDPKQKAQTLPTHEQLTKVFGLSLPPPTIDAIPPPPPMFPGNAWSVGSLKSNHLVLSSQEEETP